jgi:hypothetical protein
MVSGFSLTLTNYIIFRNVSKISKKIQTNSQKKFFFLGKETKESDEIFGGIYHLLK